ncbi:virulence factor MviN [Candidatus Saccharibacteria bacterium CG_4_10_14_0_2_um_filter_52_9]|nr:MAG: virulence factor MviN [Candidatus Saccharibacteria bacterium CG_4_10_14_0_2_um_filter_52_9]
MNPAQPDKKTGRISISNAAALLVATAFLGQLLGFLRTKLVNANFPITGPGSTDAYFAAFTIPDFFFFTLAAGALGVAFMPVLSDRFHKGDRKGVWDLSASLMNFLAILMIGVGLIMLIFAEPLIKHVVAPGLSPEQLNTATNIMRLLAFNPLLFSISGVLTSVQQTMGRFFFFAIAPLFYNLTIIISIFAFKHNIGLVGLGLGALIGAVVQLLIVMLGLWKTGFHWRPKISWQSADFRLILRNLPPRSLDQGVDQIENIVETRLASGLGAGAITYYNNAFILSTAPILLIGTAISTAAFPRLNARLSQGRPDLFRKDFLMVLRAMIWLSAPVVIVCFFARGYLARLIYSNGSPQIAIIFGFLTAAIFFRIMYSIISRWFYAQKDTKTPLFASLFAIALNITLVYTLSRPDAYGVAGLALAQSIVAAVEVFILSVIMLFRDHQLFDAKFFGGVWRILSVSGFSVVAAFIMITLYPLGLNDRGVLTLGTKLVFIAAVTFGVHLSISALFDLEEVRPVFARIRKIILKPVKLDL